jgi:hypothetical protein
MRTVVTAVAATGLVACWGVADRVVRTCATERSTQRLERGVKEANQPVTTFSKGSTKDDAVHCTMCRHCSKHVAKGVELGCEGLPN